MVEWLSGNRIRGTSAERTTDTGFPVTGVAGGWVELGRTTLGSAGDTIDVTGLADKRYIKILRYIISSGNTVVYNRLNNDSGSNYSYRWSENGGTDGTGTSVSEVIYDTGGDAGDKFDVTYISNLAGKEKLAIGHQINEDVSGAGNVPVRGEAVWKWTNTSDAVDQITTNNTGQSGDYNTGSEVVVLGWDPADTHTTNFWEELASVNASGSSTTLDSGTFTAKKYLWVQIYLEGASNLTTELFRYNNDSTNSYSQRSQRNGAKPDVTNVNISHGNVNVTGGAEQKGLFYNGFIINNSANEKLAIYHGVGQNTAGAGTAPVRVENAHKWARTSGSGTGDTSSQITRLTILQDNSVNFGSSSIIKVWGHD